MYLHLFGEDFYPLYEASSLRIIIMWLPATIWGRVAVIRSSHTTH